MALGDTSKAASSVQTDNETKNKRHCAWFLCLPALFMFVATWFLSKTVISADSNSTLVVADEVKSAVIKTDNASSVEWKQYTYGIKLRVPLPIIVLGMPKSGTTTIFKFFQCGGYRASHYQCDNPILSPHGHKFCGHCILENVMKNKPPLQGCGKFDVWAEINVAEPPIYFPQVESLEELHEAYPYATFILNMRNATAWLKSVDNWSDYRQKFIETNITGLPPGIGEDEKDMLAFYNQHSENVRRFCKEHPSHKLVEANLDDPKTGVIMAREFGVPQNCWGHEKDGETRPKKKNHTGWNRGDYDWAGTSTKTWP